MSAITFYVCKVFPVAIYFGTAGDRIEVGADGLSPTAIGGGGLHCKGYLSAVKLFGGIFVRLIFDCA